MTSAASAIKGTAFGVTKLAASIIGNPAWDSASMNAIFASVENAQAWFCNPSRGATSTMRTSSGSASVAIILSCGFGVDDAGSQVLLDQFRIAIGRWVITATTR